MPPQETPLLTRTPKQLCVPSMVAYLAAVYDCRLFWLSLAAHDIGKRYRQSTLGVGWAMLQPFLLALVISGLLKRALQGGSTDYFLYVLVGLCFWNYLTFVISAGCQSICSAEYYILQHRVPMAIYPLRFTLVGAFHLLIALVPAYAMSLRNGVPGIGTVLSMPLVFAVLLIFGWAMATVFGIANLYFPDTQHLCQVFLRILFYATPIIWQPAMLKGHKLSWIVEYNPLAAMVDAIRGPLLGDGLPSTAAMLLALATTVASIALAAFLLAKCERKIVFRF
jgi:lipopolysaccharide transport system permease protein